MPTVAFTANLRRHVGAPTVEVEGDTVRRVLDAVFADHERLRGYVLDDQGALRKHMAVFVDNLEVVDRTHLSDSVDPGAKMYVMQALSGG